jgi:hypothetical protein
MFICMRTTVRLDPDLMEAAKRYALDTGRTLTALIEDSLREALARALPSARREPLRLHTVLGDGVQPGVDLDDTAGLLDRMEGA